MPEMLELLFPLLIVILIIFLAYASTKWLSKKYNTVNFGKHIKVIERTALSKDASLVLVEISSKKYLMSVSSQRIEILLDFEEEELNQTEPDGKKSDFKLILSSITSRQSFLGELTGKTKKDDNERENR